MIRREQSSQLARYLADLDRDFLPNLSTNTVIFAIFPDELRVLLLRWLDDGEWSVPGSYVKRDEDLDQAAVRSVKDTVGLEGLSIQQVGAFGRIGRNVRTLRNEKFAGELGLPADHWIFGRVISVAYVALINSESESVQPTPMAAGHVWADVSDLPDLMFDHREIIKRALQSLRESLDHLPLGDLFAGRQFTMPQLQALYEIVLGRELDRRNFSKRMLDGGLVARINGEKAAGKRRPAYLYEWIGLPAG